MEEATRDKQGSTSEPKKNKQTTQGWIRIHSDETMKTPPVDEPVNEEAQTPNPKSRNNLRSKGETKAA